MVNWNGATALKSFKAAVASVLSDMFLIGGSVALSIHIVLTFFRMHGLALTLAFVLFWLVGVTVFLHWKEKKFQQRNPVKAPTVRRNSRKPAEHWREKQSA